MNKPNVQLKCVKTFRGMEGYGVSADVYINGVKCMIAIDNANGGSMEFSNYGYDGKIKSNIQELEDYIETLPELKNEYFNTDMTHKQTMEDYINELLTEKEIEKENKKLLKLYETAIVVGVPNSPQYSYFGFKQPLRCYERQHVQKQLNMILSKHCANGAVVMNTNLAELGLTINP